MEKDFSQSVDNNYFNYFSVIPVGGGYFPWFYEPVPYHVYFEALGFSGDCSFRSDLGGSLR